MANESLVKLFEHNNWANEQIIQVCMALSAEQLDAQPKSITRGSIRSTLFHLATAQRSYLRTLTMPLAERLGPVPEPPFDEIPAFVANSGAALLALAADEVRLQSLGRLRTRDGYMVEPWVLMIQIINHATEHREQIKSMLSDLGITPPDIDGWAYGEVTSALVLADKDGGN